MHVGDLYHVDVLGARAAGIQPLLLDPHGLYQEFDVTRIGSLGELPSHVARLRPARLGEASQVDTDEHA
jgi:FMN phosphatase YigB (HAD superfamily)